MHDNIFVNHWQTVLLRLIVRSLYDRPGYGVTKFVAALCDNAKGKLKLQLCIYELKGNILLCCNIVEKPNMGNGSEGLH